MQTICALEIICAVLNIPLRSNNYVHQKLSQLSRKPIYVFINSISYANIGYNGYHGYVFI